MKLNENEKYANVQPLQDNCFYNFATLENNLMRVEIRVCIGCELSGGMSKTKRLMSLKGGRKNLQV